MNDSSFDIFVPGRVCLFGEHSDWAGAHRRFNPAILPGQVIIAGTNQGIFAKATPIPDIFKLKSTLPDGKVEEQTIPMHPAALLAVAREGGFFSYAAGVAYYLGLFHQIGGLEIDNYKTTMPVKKGLSSSAAFCVLVARAFNLAYNLKLNIRGEMEAAYQGEILTPSRCGRMDQGCAYGQGPVIMTFDGDFMDAKPLNVAKPFHLLIADLKGQKDTVRILSDLTSAYPEANSEQDRMVHKYLGKINQNIVTKAVKFLTEGDAVALGELMTEAQAEFDKHLQPACPKELTAPKLHAILKDETVKQFTYGGKGIGSQGDGCVQFVAKSVEARDQLVQYLSKTFGLDCFPLDIMPAKTVRKAIIPAAGLGTRMFPATKAVKKELFPVVTPDGLCKPILQTIVEEVVNAGVEDIAIIVRPSDEKAIADFFAPVEPSYYERLPEWAKQECRHLEELGRKITFIRQTEQLGFGHAVYCAREWTHDEPTLLLLGDHLYSSNTEKSCASQLIEAFNQCGCHAIVSLYPAPGNMVHHYGTATGSWANPEHTIIKLTEFAEKPTLEYARQHLTLENYPQDQFLCVYGQYVLTPELFEILGRQIENNVRQKGEFQLTTALDELRATSGMFGYLVDGKHLDTGQPMEYLQSLNSFMNKNS
ncbi:MAG: NTP transferase domain-containing protein [Victivallales bacterium]|nr:NTP transferase domain-containing protein [Victivallales bacterium]